MDSNMSSFRKHSSLWCADVIDGDNQIKLVHKYKQLKDQ